MVPVPDIFRLCTIHSTIPENPITFRSYRNITIKEIENVTLFIGIYEIEHLEFASFLKHLQTLSCFLALPIS